MNRPIPGTTQVSVRHILSDRTTGGVVRPRTRTITFRDSRYRVRRPSTGTNTVELTCTVCDTSLRAEVHDEARTRRIGALLLTLAALCAVLLVVAFGYAVQQGGRTLPEGESLPTLFTVSILTVAVMFVATPLLYVAGRNHNGVTLLGTRRERKGHRILPVRG